MTDTIYLNPSDGGEGAIQEAINNRKHLMFDYENARGDRGKYMVYPLEIETSKKGHRYLLCHYRKSKNEYRAPGYEKPGKRVLTTDELDNPPPIRFSVDRMSNIEIPRWYEWLFVYWI